MLWLYLRRSRPRLRQAGLGCKGVALKTKSLKVLFAFAACCLGGLARGGDAVLSEAERRIVASLSLAALPPLPPDPTDRAAGNPTAMALGATLFFDMRLSANGKVSCSTCHQIGNQFQDGLPLGMGIGIMNRRTQPLAGVAWGRSFFWDGRKDSLWSQALAPLERPEEHGLTRAGVAHFMALNFRDRYERVFGPMPDLSGVPADAGPLGNAAQAMAWRALTPARQEAVDQVFANTGKLIASFERSLKPPETRFDRFAAAVAANIQPAGDATFSSDEIAGLKLFVDAAGCVRCHAGPLLTDGCFHNTGIPSGIGLPPDVGREQGIADFAADPFNCVSRFSDASANGCSPENTDPSRNANLAGAFKTPSLRGVAERPPYMHAGQFATLDQVLDHYENAPAAAIGHSEIAPIRLSAADRKALVAFLKTLD